MTLEQVMKDIKQRVTSVSWDGGEDRLGDVSPTGEAYIVLCSGGVKAEGEKYPALFTTKADAIKTYHFALNDFVSRGSGVLYWRVEPELIDAVDEVPEWTSDYRYAVYSRLLFSNKTVVKKARGFTR